MKGAFRFLGALVAAGLIGYFAYFIYTNFDADTLSILMRPQVVAALAAAALLYAMIIPISGWAWQKLLASVSVPKGMLELSGIMGATQLAKYLPGNIAQHASRVMLSLSRGMPADAYAMTVVVETVLAISAAVIVTIGLTVLSPGGLAVLPYELRQSLPWIVLSLPILLLLLPLVLKKAILIGSRRSSWIGERFRDNRIPGGRAQSLALAAYMANYLLIGIGFLLIVRAMEAGPSLGYSKLTAAFAASWIAGFVAPGVPAGLGVREGVMAMMLVDDSPDEALLGAITGMRLATVLGDLLWFVLGGAILHSIGKRGAE